MNIIRRKIIKKARFALREKYEDGAIFTAKFEFRYNDSLIF